MDLLICHPDREQFPILHGNSQGFLTRERPHTDHSPVSGFDDAAVDLFDLSFRQIRTVPALQSFRLLQPADRTVLIDLSDPDQSRIGKFHALYIGDKLFRPAAYFYIRKRELLLSLFFLFPGTVSSFICASAVCITDCLTVFAISFRREVSVILPGRRSVLTGCITIGYAQYFHELFQSDKSAPGNTEIVHLAVYIVVEVHGIDDTVNREAFRLEFHTSGICVTDFYYFCALFSKMDRIHIDLRISPGIGLHHRRVVCDTDIHIRCRLDLLPVSHDPDIKESGLLLRKLLILIKTDRSFCLLKIFLICVRACLDLCDLENRLVRDLCLRTVDERDCIVTAPCTEGTAFGFFTFPGLFLLFRG